MEFFWISFVLFLTAPPISGFQCYSCDGDRDCLETEVCEEHQEQCSTTVMTVISRPKISTYFLKGCDISGKPNNSISHFSGNQVVFLAEEYCDTELCNKRSPNVVDVLVARGRQRRTMDCYSCTTADKTCYNSSLVLMKCARPEEHCTSGENSVVKGCASPSWCDSPYTAVYKNLGAIHSRCCTSSLCNNWIVDGTLKPSPRSRAVHTVQAQQILLSTALLLSVAFLLSSGSS
ncbi:hypothetical protein JD844_005761 [Phrynosoma platyrhinos]|uniref:Urokinase plasminogen activator surface receptor n=1 Tax=Phrynosoma platyrhinos TaxID=52577 RepID=A0ABQ7TNR6_PHRPL|nr:hypothetical protein JD844_005761 [Phrynosoma platyrhinos]